MTFLQPWWWLLALLAVPLALWHGRRSRTTTVATLRVWRDVAAAQARPRARFGLSRPTTSLLLQLAALLALTLALAGPRVARPAVDHQVFVLDLSASMSAVHDEGTRLDLARERARSELRALDAHARGGPLVSLVTVGAEVRVEAARLPTSDAVVARLDALRSQTAPEAAPWRRVADTVAGLVRPNESSHVTVLTDGAAASEAESAFEGEERTGGVAVLAFGDAAQTLGLSAVRGVPLEPAEGTWRIEGEVAAFPPPEEPVRIEVAYARVGIEGDIPWDEVTVRARDERTAFSFETRLPDAGMLTLRLPGDAFPADDVARLALRRDPVPLRILVQGAAPRALTEALEALEAAEVVVRAADAVAPEGEAPFDLAVVVGAPAADASPRLAATTLWLAGASPRGVHPAHPDAPAFVAPGLGHDRFSPVTDLPEGAIEVAYDVPRLAGAKVLLDGPAGPLLQVRELDGLRDVVAAWDLGATAWARELGFATFMAELARVAAPRHGAWTGPRCTVGHACGIEPGGIAPTDLALAPDDPMPLIVDREAGPESDLRVAGADAAGATAAPFPGRRSDRALAALAALLLSLDGLRTWRRRRGGARTGRGRSVRRIARGARIASVLLLTCVATGLPTPLPRPQERTVLVVDPWAWPSAPVADATAYESVARLPARFRAVVSAEGEGRLVAGFGDAWNGAVTAREPAVGHARAAVLDMAAGLLAGRGGRLVLAGVSLPADVATSALAEDLASRGITVDVLPAAAPAADEAWVEALHVPATVRADERVTVRTLLAGPGADGSRVRVSVDGTELGTHEGSGTLSWDTGSPGVRTVRAELVGDRSAGVAANDARTLLVEVQSAGRVALVAEEGAPTALLASRLRAGGHEVLDWRPDDLPYAPEDLLGVDVVALLDVAAVALHGRQQEALDAWVRESGGGVLIAGARGAYGPGGYLRTPLEELAPLSARVPGERPRAAMAFVLDRSGSMQQAVAGISRLAVAKEAAVAAAELLHPESQVAVVVFDDVARTLVPLGPPVGLREALAPVAPGGGTNLYPALEAALAELEGSDAAARHMIVMTDGLAQPAPFDALIDRIVASGVTLSAVAIGDGADRSLLQGMARRGGGAFHASDDVAALPSILSQEAMLLSGNPVREGLVVPRFEGGAAAFTEGLPGPFPPIGGYVRTTPKPEAEVHATTPDGDPILASWRHGVGRVVALSTPLVGDWSSSWTSSPFATRLTAQAFRWLASPALDPGTTLDVVRRGDTLHVEATVIGAEGTPETGARLDLVVTDPLGTERAPLALAERVPGRYVTEVPVHEAGRYRLVAVPRDLRSVAAERAAEREVHVAFPATLAPSAAGAAGLSELARATGGELALDRRLSAMPARWRFEPVPTTVPWALLAVVAAAVGLAAETWPVRRRSADGAVPAPPRAREDGGASGGRRRAVSGTRRRSHGARYTTSSRSRR